MLSGAPPRRGVVGVLLLSFHPSNQEPGGPDTLTSHVASAASIPPSQQLLFTGKGSGRGQEAAPLTVTQIGAWTGDGGRAAADGGQPVFPTSTLLLGLLLLLRQSHPQTQQPESSGSASVRSTWREQSSPPGSGALASPSSAWALGCSQGWL